MVSNRSQFSLFILNDLSRRETSHPNSKHQPDSTGTKSHLCGVPGSTCRWDGGTGRVSSPGPHLRLSTPARSRQVRGSQAPSSAHTARGYLSPATNHRPPSVGEGLGLSMSHCSKEEPPFLGRSGRRTVPRALLRHNLTTATSSQSIYTTAS